MKDCSARRLHICSCFSELSQATDTGKQRALVAGEEKMGRLHDPIALLGPRAEEPPPSAPRL